MIAGMILAGVIFAAGLVILISAVAESVKQNKKEKERRKEDGKDKDK